MNKDLKQLSDQALVQLFRQGNQSAIAELISRYQSNVYTSIYYLVKDKYIAEDLFQDTFLKIMRHLQKDKYEEQGKFLPWTLRIAHNLCIDYFRKIKQQAKITTSDGTDFFARYTFNEDHAESNLIKRQTENTVQNLIDQLPQEQKEVVLLRIYGELSFKEIAGITEVSINTALGRMRYALNNMRRLIQEKKLVLR
jgi:RNA polymerase sigma-70 factor (ECF subfamily)